MRTTYGNIILSSGIGCRVIDGWIVANLEHVGVNFPLPYQSVFLGVLITVDIIHVPQVRSTLRGVLDRRNASYNARALPDNNKLADFRDIHVQHFCGVEDGNLSFGYHHEVLFKAKLLVHR
jgi:hypothetical protein